MMQILGIVASSGLAARLFGYLPKPIATKFGKIFVNSNSQKDEFSVIKNTETGFEDFYTKWSQIVPGTDLNTSQFNPGPSPIGVNAQGKYVILGENKTAVSTDAINWQYSNFVMTGDSSVIADLKDIAYNEISDRWILVGGNSTYSQYGCLAVSTDALSWSNLNNSVSFEEVEIGSDGVTVLVGASGLYSTTNNTPTSLGSFTNIIGASTGTSSLMSVSNGFRSSSQSSGYYGVTQWGAIRNNGTVLSSTNGTNWTTSYTPPSTDRKKIIRYIPSGYEYSVSIFDYHSNGFWISLNDIEYSATDGYSRFSTNLVHWATISAETERGQDSVLGRDLYFPTKNFPYYVAISGSYGAAGLDPFYVSTDGLSWVGHRIEFVNDLGFPSSSGYFISDDLIIAMGYDNGFNLRSGSLEYINDIVNVSKSDVAIDSNTIFTAGPSATVTYTTDNISFVSKRNIVDNEDLQKSFNFIEKIGNKIYTGITGALTYFTNDNIEWQKISISPGDSESFTLDLVKNNANDIVESDDFIAIVGDAGLLLNSNKNADESGTFNPVYSATNTDYAPIVNDNFKKVRSNNNDMVVFGENAIYKTSDFLSNLEAYPRFSQIGEISEGFNINIPNSGYVSLFYSSKLKKWISIFPDYTNAPGPGNRQFYIASSTDLISWTPEYTPGDGYFGELNWFNTRNSVILEKSGYIVSGLYADYPASGTTYPRVVVTNLQSIDVPVNKRVSNVPNTFASSLVDIHKGYLNNLDVAIATWTNDTSSAMSIAYSSDPFGDSGSNSSGWQLANDSDFLAYSIRNITYIEYLDKHFMTARPVSNTSTRYLYSSTDLVSWSQGPTVSSTSTGGSANASPIYEHQNTVNFFTYNENTDSFMILNKSTDSASWEQFETIIPIETIDEFNNIHNIDDVIYYAHKSNSLYVSFDGGISWIKKDTGLAGAYILSEIVKHNNKIISVPYSTLSIQDPIPIVSLDFNYTKHLNDYANGYYFGELGSIYSENAEYVENNMSMSFKDIEYDGEHYFASTYVPEGFVWTSEGQLEIALDGTGTSPKYVATDGEYFVFHTGRLNKSEIAYSTDVVHWSTQAIPGWWSNISHYDPVSKHKDRWITSSSRAFNSSSSVGDEIYTSTNLQSWTSVSLSDQSTYKYRVTHVKELDHFFAFGEKIGTPFDISIYKSTDSISWAFDHYLSSDISFNSSTEYSYLSLVRNNLGTVIIASLDSMAIGHITHLGSVQFDQNIKITDLAGSLNIPILYPKIRGLEFFQDRWIALIGDSTTDSESMVAVIQSENGIDWSLSKLYNEDFKHIVVSDSTYFDYKLSIVNNKILLTPSRAVNLTFNRPFVTFASVDGINWVKDSRMQPDTLAEGSSEVMSNVFSFNDKLYAINSFRFELFSSEDIFNEGNLYSSTDLMHWSKSVDESGEFVL